MSVTIVAGAATANSYVTVVEATAFFDGRLDSAEWTTAGTTSPETQTTALAMAARRLNQELWAGTIADEDQSLEWPRTGAYDRNGYAYASDAIPQPVKNAQMELALVLLKGTDSLDDTGLEGFERLKVGPLEMVMRQRTAGQLQANVRREIAFLLTTPSAYGFHVERG